MKEKTEERYKDIKNQIKKSARSYGKVFIRSPVHMQYVGITAKQFGAIVQYTCI